MLAALIFTLFLAPYASAAPKIQAAQPAQLELLKNIDQKYQKASAIGMNVEKSDTVAALDQTRVFAGTLVLKRGKFRLDLQSKDQSKDKSLIVADGKNLWLVTPPPKEFKNAKTQIVKASLEDKRARSQGLLQILTEGGILKYFKVSGVLDEDSQLTFHLQPISQSIELRRAQLIVNKSEQTITSLRYWDTMDNETVYSFSKVDFNKNVKDELLKYSPPKDADVMSY